jgi:DNA-binding transcriptional MerR regulator
MAYMLESVARITGATVKQLIHWDLTGLLRPSVAQASGRGSRRVYSFLDVLAIKTAVMLRHEGVRLEKVRRCMRYLNAHRREVEQPQASQFLVTDGVQLFVLSEDLGEASRYRYVSDTLASGQLLFLIPIGRIACEARRDVARFAPDVPTELPAATPPGVRQQTQRKVRLPRKGLRAG